MDKKSKIIIIVLLLLLGISIGAGVYMFFNKSEPTTIPVEVIPDNTKELAKIDSLNALISDKNKEIKKLKEEISKKKAVVVNEVEEIKQLQIDENIQLMHDNLVAYGELTKYTDSLAKIININGEIQIDSGIVITENNLKDVNIIAAKYSGELEVNDLLNEEILLDSVILSKKDSIILQNAVMIEKQEVIYNINMDSLQKSLEQEKKNKKTIAWVLGGTAVVSLTLSGFLLAGLLSK